MKLYYTTITRENDIQNKPEYSLGGFKSATPVLNSVEGNLFSRISLNTIEKNQSEYIGLILKNELNIGVNDILIWTESNEGAISKFEFSAVTLSSGQFEHIPNRFSKPFISDFYSAEGEENAINVGDLASQEMIGIWIKRVLLQDTIKQQKTSQYLLEHFGQEPELNEEISIKISYTSSYGDPIGGSNV